MEKINIDKLMEEIYKDVVRKGDFLRYLNLLKVLHKSLSIQDVLDYLPTIESCNRSTFLTNFYKHRKEEFSIDQLKKLLKYKNELDRDIVLDIKNRIAPNTIKGQIERM